MKRKVEVFRMGKGFRVIDKGVKIFETPDQSSESRIRVRNFLIKNDLRATQICINRFSWLWIRENLPNLIVVDFQTRKDEMDLTKIFDKFGVTVDDWMEKDYGVKSWVCVPPENLVSFKSEIGNFNGATYSDVDQDGQEV